MPTRFAGGLRVQPPPRGGRAAHVRARAAGVPRDAMVRRPLVRVPLPDARGRSAPGHAAAGLPRDRHGSATSARPLDLLLRLPAFLLRILSLRGRARRPALLEPLLRLVAVRRPVRARPPLRARDRLPPLARPTHGEGLEPDATAPIRGGAPDRNPRRDRDHPPDPPTRHPDRDLRLPRRARRFGASPAGSVHDPATPRAAREPRHARRPSDPVRATVLGLLLARSSRALSVA